MVDVSFGEVKEVPEKLKKLVEVALAEAIENYQRRMIVLCGEKAAFYSGILSALTAKSLEKLLPQVRILYVTEKFEEEWKERFEDFKRGFRIYGKDLDFEKIIYKETVEVMGRTYEILILDMVRSLTPDDIGRVFGVVRGGGLIFVIAPPFEKWPEIKTTFHEHLLTPPYTLKDTKNRFLKRFVRKLKEHSGIYIYDAEREEMIKSPETLDRDLNVIFPEFEKPRIPLVTKFDKKIYELAATEDQVKVLQLLEEILDKRKVAYVITADRGRGKSAVVGLALAAISKIYYDKKRKLRIGVTAPEKENVLTLFEFLEKGLRRLKLDYEKRKDRIVIEGKKPIIIEYRKPLELVEKKYDIVAVDEAAGININMLYRILDRFDKLIFSSTTHGYEGAGRTFSVRFLKYLKEETDFEVIEYKMKKPIRYSENDPIERWLFDTLVLDAEPAQLDKRDLEAVEKLDTKFYTPDLDSWFEKEENKLRQFVGIYILAHYKNRPNDIAMIADAPHHDARALELSTGKIVTAIQVAYEGGIPENVIKQMLKGYKPKGNVIPDIITKHYRRLDFAKLKGIRIVRIATHPDVQNRGLGSKALQELAEQAKKEGYDWIGSGFGATVKLLNFWIKNGFVPVHISSEKNPVSGEYSVIVVKPLSPKAEKIIREVNYEFRWKFLNQVTDTFFDIEPELALLLLKTPYRFKPHFKPLLTKVQLDKFKAYFKTKMVYEVASDCVRLATMYYFMYTDKDKPQLEEIEEKILFSKVFLAWSFKKIRKYFGIKESKARKIIKRASKKLYEWIKDKV